MKEVQLTWDNKQIQQFDNAWVLECFQDFDLTQSGNWHSFTFVVHEDTFQCDQVFCTLVECLVDFTE